MRLPIPLTTPVRYNGCGQNHKWEQAFLLLYNILLAAIERLKNIEWSTAWQIYHKQFLIVSVIRLPTEVGDLKHLKIYLAASRSIRTQSKSLHQQQQEGLTIEYHRIWQSFDSKTAVPRLESLYTWKSGQNYGSDKVTRSIQALSNCCYPLRVFAMNEDMPVIEVNSVFVAPHSLQRSLQTGKKQLMHVLARQKRPGLLSPPPKRRRVHLYQPSGKLLRQWL